jgi:hypothetical protein
MEDGFLLGTRIVHHEWPVALPSHELDYDRSIADDSGVLLDSGGDAF